MNEYAQALTAINNLIVVMQSQTLNTQTMFFSDTPQDINLKKIDESGDVIEVAIPNLAKMTANFVSDTELNSRLTEMHMIIGNRAPMDHSHDGRYYTESEVDTKLDEKADVSHSHDDCVKKGDSIYPEGTNELNVGYDSHRFDQGYINMLWCREKVTTGKVILPDRDGVASTIEGDIVMQDGGGIYIRGMNGSLDTLGKLTVNPENRVVVWEPIS